MTLWPVAAAIGVLALWIGLPTTAGTALCIAVIAFTIEVLVEAGVPWVWIVAVGTMVTIDGAFAQRSGREPG